MDALAPWDVTAVIVTRGDCELSEVIESLIFEKFVVWDNSIEGSDMGAFGRYLAAVNAGGVIYFQDDDCIIPGEDQLRLVAAYEPGILTALMPPERVDYIDTVLVGWGSICDSELPWEAFTRWQRAGFDLGSDEFRVIGADFVFPMLSKWKRLDGYHRDLPHAHAPNRTWASWPNYADVKNRYLREARLIRDGR